MLTRLITTLILTLTVGLLSAQQAPYVPIPAQQILLEVPPPLAPTVTANYNGPNGSDTYYYWVVANYPVGISPSNAAVISQAFTLSSTATVSLSWNRPNGVVSFDVVRLTTPNLVNCSSCLLANDTTAATFTDTGSNVGNFALGTVLPVGRAVIGLDNWNFNPPRITINRVIEAPGGGFVIGPASSVDNGIAVFDGVTGALIKQGGGTLDASGNLVLGDGPTNITVVTDPSAPTAPAAADRATIYVDRATGNLCYILTGGGAPLCAVTSAVAGITDLNGQTGATQTFGDDSNVTIVSAANVHQLGWTGVLPLSRGGLNSSTMESRVDFGCQGTATSSATLFIYRYPPGNCTATVEDGRANLVVSSAGTIRNLRAVAGAGSQATSGIITVRVNAADTAVTCTIGTGTTCSDTVNTVSVAAGDRIAVKYTTAAVETLIGLRVSFEY